MHDTAMMSGIAVPQSIGALAPMLLKVVTGAALGWVLSRVLWALLRAHAVTRYLFDD